MGQIVQAAFRCGAAITITILSVAAAGGTQAKAAASADCSAANSGSMNVEIAPGQGAMREVSLEAGEMLSIAVTTSRSASVVLVGGVGAPRTLHAGATNASITFPAAEASAYAFQFNAEQAPATVRVRCASAEDAAARSAFLARRNDLLTSQEPDRIRIDRPSTPVVVTDQSHSDLGSIGKPKPAKVSISVSEIAAAANPRAKPEPGILDFWFEGRFQPYETADATGAPGEGNLGVVYAGSKYMLGPDIMIGALAQLDRADERSATLSREASAGGWLAGPYASVRFGPGVVFDGRVAWGKTQSGVPGLALGDETTDRRLVRGTLRGNRQIGTWTFAPSVSMTYVEDTPRTPLASDPAQPSVSAGQGRLDVMPEFKRRFDINGETYFEPRAAVGGFVSFDDLSSLNPAAAAGTADLHMKAEAGVAVGVKDGMNLEARGGVETGAAAEPDNWSGRLQLNMPLGK